MDQPAGLGAGLLDRPVGRTADPPSANPTTATIDQVRRLLTRLPADREVPMLVFDAGYDPIALGHDLAEQRVQVLVRISPKRVFHPDPPPRRAGSAAAHPGTGHASRYRTPRPAGPRPMPSTASTTRSTATSTYKPGAGCTPNCTAKAAGPVTTRRRS